jgi:DNA-binding transcriptional regulator YiaG
MDFVGGSRRTESERVQSRPPVTLRSERVKLISSSPTLRLSVRELRKRCGVSQAVFARRLRVSTQLVQKWEFGSRTPSGPALILLQLVERFPDFSFMLLGMEQERMDSADESLDVPPLIGNLGARGERDCPMGDRRTDPPRDTVEMDALASLLLVPAKHPELPKRDVDLAGAKPRERGGGGTQMCLF